MYIVFIIIYYMSDEMQNGLEFHLDCAFGHKNVTRFGTQEVIHKNVTRLNAKI